MRFYFYSSLLVVLLMVAVASVLLGIVELTNKLDYAKDQFLDQFKFHYKGQHRRATA